MNRLYYFIDLFFHILPVNNKRVMFTSFWGQYNDNPKYISEKIHKLNPEIKIYWGISKNRSTETTIPEYVNICRYKSIKYYWCKNRCKVVVDNIVGDYCFYGKNAHLSWKRIIKNKKQFNLSTWHGNPIKKIGNDLYPNIKKDEDSFYSTSDLLICGCKYVFDIFSSCFKGGPSITITGTPRCDAMFDENVEVTLLKTKLNIPIDYKVLLYAPTYRNNPNDSGVNQIRSIDIDKLLNLFSNKFGGNWVMVFRVHNSVLSVLRNSVVFNDQRIINGNQGDDMMEYMQVSDAMISDYSGCIFDYAHTAKPCFLYALDKENYIKHERGTYIGIEKLPYLFYETPESLYDAILKYDSGEQILRNRFFNDLIGNIEDGKASERVANIIFNKLSL